MLLVNFIAPLRERFLHYGPRAATGTSSTAVEREKAANERADIAPFTVLLNRVADLRVPHGWFTSFYELSVLSSLLWASQIFTKGPGFSSVAWSVAPQEATMTYRKVLVAWALLLVQGSRRLYECLVFSKPSKSQMWFGHWVLGIGFYVATGVAVWVEGIRECSQHALRSRCYD